MGFINQLGEELIAPLQYDFVDDFAEGFARVTRDGRFGYVNTIGEEVIPCIYESAWNFSEGLAAVKIKGRWGFINDHNEVIIDFVFENIAMGFKEGLCGVVNQNTMGFINKSGKVQIPFLYDASLVLNECYHDFRNGFCPVKLMNTDNHIYIDYNGNQIGGLFNITYGFTEGKGLVVRDDQWGYIDSKGLVVIPCKYKHASFFSNGVGIVKLN